MEKKINVILGFTGGIGRAVAKALVARNEKVVCLVRSIDKAQRYAEGLEGIEFVQGDASNPPDVEKVTQNAATLFYCVNIPYPEWKEKAVKLLSVSVEAAIKNNVKLVFPGNVYVYGRAQSKLVSEGHPHAPLTRKGKIRVEMENMLIHAKKEQGLAYTIVRMPDFYGPYVINGFTEQFLLRALKGKSLTWYGSLKDPAEFIFIEDGGEAMVIAGLSEKSNGYSFNVPGCKETTPKLFLSELVKQSGKKSKIKQMNLILVMNFVGLFNIVAKEFSEMLYLKQERFILNGAFFKSFFGVLPATSYEEGIEKTLAWTKKYYHI